MHCGSYLVDKRNYKHEADKNDVQEATLTR